MQQADIKEKYVPRLLVEYRGTIALKMKDTFDYKNILSVPRILKIVLNMGVNGATSDSKLVDRAAVDLATITGQKAKITRARKPISNFKIRENIPLGCCVILRRYRMYEFLDRLISIAIPRIRDFRGLSRKSFDGHGNYAFGLTEQTIFPEINADKTEKMQGMDIIFNTNARTDEEAEELLKLFGFPFRR